MKRLWLVSYDIADDRRRYRVARKLLGHGDRVLESLFECHLRAEQARTLHRQVLSVIDSAEDRVAFVPLCRWCQENARRLGQGAGSSLARAPLGACGHFAVL